MAKYIRLNQKSNLKMQNEKSKFKKEFIKRLIVFTVDIVSLVREVKQDRTLWSIGDQLIRSAGSIGANVVEAKNVRFKKRLYQVF